MGLKLGAGLAAVILIVLVSQGCVFGGGDDGGSGTSITRPGSIPTATLPATLTDPILLGQSQGGTGSAGSSSGGSGQTYTIKSGDTLGGIAASLGVPADQQAAWIAEVLRLNGISDARLLAVGQELTLPRVATSTSTPRSATAPGTPAATTATPNRTTTPGTASTPQATTAASTPTVRPTASGGSGRSYTVVSGDTPLVIAGKLGVPSAQQTAWANEMVALNGINPNAMQVGDVLQLPVGTP